MKKKSLLLLPLLALALGGCNAPVSIKNPTYLGLRDIMYVYANNTPNVYRYTQRNVYRDTDDVWDVGLNYAYRYDMGAYGSASTLTVCPYMVATSITHPNKTITGTAFFEKFGNYETDKPDVITYHGDFVVVIHSYE